MHDVRRPLPLSFRLLGEEDLPFAMDLKRRAGWNQTLDDWRRFLALEPSGCFLAQWGSEPPVPVGTVTTTSYGSRFGWIGMVLVLPEYRRRGIGSALLQQALGYLGSRGLPCARLDATPLGELLYQGLGFRREYVLERLEGRAAGSRAAPGRRMAPEDLASVIAYDAERFGAARPRLLEGLYRQCPEFCFVGGSPPGGLEGYLMARPGEFAWQIGPWVAEGPAPAECLLRAGLHALADQPVFLDVPREQNEAVPLLQSLGFRRQRPFVRMARGPLETPGRPDRMFAICGVETG